jgi:aminoglycoside 3-N-acetyltransferase
MHSRSELADDFRRLGVQSGMTAMLHASVRAVGPVAGGPDQIHLALGDALAEAGTLVMYASCPDGYDDVGRGGLSPEDERELLEKLPVFDPLTARAARDNGTLVEFFRTSPGVVVNNHVARFVVRGGQARHLVTGQPWDYAFGHGSLLERFAALDGHVLLLGCDHDTVTFLHYAEHIVEIPGKRVARFKVPVRETGSRVWRDMEEVDTSSAGAHPNWPNRFFARLVGSYMRETENRCGRVGDAPTVLLPAQGLLAFALEAMKRVAADALEGERLTEADAGQEPDAPH